MPLVLALLVLAMLAYILSGTIMMKVFMLSTGILALAIGVIGSKLWASWSEEGKRTGSEMALLSRLAGIAAFCSWTWVIVCISYFVWWS